MKNRDFLKWISYALVTVLAFTLQELLFSRLRIGGIAPVFGGAVVAVIAMFEGVMAGGIFGVVCGALLYQTPGGGEILYIFIYAAGGIAIGALCSYMFRRRLVTALMWSLALNAVATLSYMLVFFVMTRRVGFSALYTTALPEILYSTAVTPLIYFPLREIFTRRKALDD